MTKYPPCAACKHQVTLKRNAKPHAAMVVVETEKADGEETTYKCEMCGSLIGHTTDPDEIAPFWWFVE